MGLGIGKLISFGVPPGSGVSAAGSSSGVQKYAADFVGVTSGQFVHALGTKDVIVSVYDSNYEEVIVDRIIVESINIISVVNNIPMTGRVVIIG